MHTGTIVKQHLFMSLNIEVLVMKTKSGVLEEWTEDTAKAKHKLT